MDFSKILGPSPLVPAGMATPLITSDIFLHPIYIENLLYQITWNWTSFI